MNSLELQKKLMAVARANPPSESVPYAFEKRVMARILSESVLDVWSFWGRLLWRAAAPCLAIMIAITVWAVVSNGAARSRDTLAVELENTVLAPLARLEETAW